MTWTTKPRDDKREKHICQPRRVDIPKFIKPQKDGLVNPTFRIFKKSKMFTFIDLIPKWRPHKMIGARPIRQRG